MGGFFAAATHGDCVGDLFYGTDYHSHLGTRRGGMAIVGPSGIVRFIHDITNAQFRSKFETDLARLRGSLGIGVISDFEDQPLIIGSHLGTYAIVTVGRINNLAALARKAFETRATHFSEMSGGEINPTELVATLINREATFAAGIRAAQEAIDGSCSLLLLTEGGIYAARDRFGRTPVILARKEGGHAVAMETTAFPNLDYEIVRYLGPGEIMHVTADTAETVAPQNACLRVCSFLWVYFGYPSSSYEGINTEVVRNRCGEMLAERDTVELDAVAGIPDSGTGHAIGYANRARVPFCRPFVKYTPTWPRSFMPQDQRVRDMVARMKLIPIQELIDGKRILFCEDSIVRGTQLRDTIRRIYAAGAREIHMRPACPPLIYGCKFLNFSRSRSDLDLAGRRAIRAIEGCDRPDLAPYAAGEGEKFERMVAMIRDELNLTSLCFQRLPDLVQAIGLPKERLCTYCWDGSE